MVLENYVTHFWGPGKGLRQGSPQTSADGQQKASIKVGLFCAAKLERSTVHESIPRLCDSWALAVCAFPQCKSSIVRFLVNTTEIVI